MITRKDMNNTIVRTSSDDLKISFIKSCSGIVEEIKKFQQQLDDLSNAISEIYGKAFEYEYGGMKMKNEHNAVLHPSHYCEGRKYEPKDVIRDWGLNFNLGSAVKYLSRVGRKGDIIEDLEKAKQFIQFEIDYLSQEKCE